MAERLTAERAEWREHAQQVRDAPSEYPAGKTLANRVLVLLEFLDAAEAEIRELQVSLGSAIKVGQYLERREKELVERIESLRRDFAPIAAEKLIQLYKAALRDAINSPKGDVPDSAEGLL